MNFLLTFMFWSAASLTLYTYVGYPIWIQARSRFWPHLWRQAPMLPSVSVILVVHNCVDLLRQKIDQLLSLDYPRERIEFIIVSDGSVDDTNCMLTSLRHPLIRSIMLRERGGKAAGLNAGMQSAKGEVLLFQDVRPRLESDSLHFLLSNFADPTVGCVTGEVVLCDDSHDQVTKAVGSLYWRYEQWMRTCESKIDSPVGVYGGFYAVRRELASSLPEATVLDDMLQPLCVIRQGYRSVLDRRAQVYDVWPKSVQSEFNRKVRTLAGNFQLLQLAPWLLTRDNRLRFELISHKLLRLIVPALLIVLLSTSVLLAMHSRLYEVAVAAQLLLYTLAAVGVCRGVPIVTRMASAARAFCILNVAAVVGFYRFLFTRGPLWKIWIPTASLPSTFADNDEATRAAAAARDMALID
jgi:cellulose synthase/poly-beta-1,6-N-acetylglucosamine synthase-like glycosyltransferase